MIVRKSLHRSDKTSVFNNANGTADNNSLHTKKMYVLCGLGCDQMILINKRHIDKYNYYTFSENCCMWKKNQTTA